MKDREVEMIQGIIKKESSAYEYIFQKYSKMVYYVVFALLSQTHSKEDIEECVADVFSDVWFKIDKFDPEKANFRTWLLVLTRYKARTYRRNKKSTHTVDIQEFELEDEVTLEKQVFLRHDMEQVIKAIHSFQKIDREIFVRRFFLGEKISDLSQMFNLSRSAIDNRLLRGRKLLKEVFKDE